MQYIKGMHSYQITLANGAGIEGIFLTRKQSIQFYNELIGLPNKFGAKSKISGT